ncbi:MAG: di-heme oxidoredictase family protein [Bacteroidota bacterium]
MKKSILPYGLIALLVMLFVQCGQGGVGALIPEEDEQYSGGGATVFSDAATAFGHEAPGLTSMQHNYFYVGNSLFNQNWVSAPATTTARDGLGPLFNARSCSGCHLRDGRAAPPLGEDHRKPGFILRMSTNNTFESGPSPDPNYGFQLQDHAIQGIDIEGALEIEYEYIRGTYADGKSYELRRPAYRITNTAHGEIQANNFSPRVANHIVGMGLLEAIPEETLVEISDPDDADGDGISGRINYVPLIEADGKLVPGRFGWKATQPTVRQQVASAFAGDMGITSELFPNENCPPNVDCAELPNGGEPELTSSALEHTTLYASTLAVPARRDWSDKNVLHGKAIFKELGCNSCHIEKLSTGKHSTFDVLSNQTIRPYTDLLLHDMGEGLADDSPDFMANGQEWRTPPLWGIGLFKIVNGHTNYLHDGRARNLEEAILWHGGEAEQSRDEFKALSAEDRADLIRFLKSL